MLGRSVLRRARLAGVPRVARLLLALAVAVPCVVVPCVVVPCVAVPSVASADEWGDEGSDEGGSDEGFDFGPPAGATPTTSSAATEPLPAAPPRWWSASAILRSDEAIWTERLGGNPFAKARQSLDLQWTGKRDAIRVVVSLHAEGDAAYLVDTASYDQATLDAYRSLLQIRETLLGLSLGAFELTLGRQIVAFGEGDALSPLDVANPRDLREPGLADLVDIRVPVLASRLGYFVGAHRLELMVIHESHFGFRTPPMGPFSPLPALLTGQGGASGIDIGALLDGKDLRYRHLQDSFATDQQQVLARWVHRGEGLDLGVVAGSVLDTNGVARTPDYAALLDASQTQLDIPLDHLRYELLGTTGATTLGDVLVKWELAFQHRRPISKVTGTTAPQLGVERIDAIEAMVGLTWRGLADTTLGLEVDKATLLDTPTAMLIPVDATQIVARIQHTALRERLDLLGVATAFGLRGQYGWLARCEASWLLRDGLRVGLGYVTYQPGDELGPFAGLDRHDRLTARLRWDLALP